MLTVSSEQQLILLAYSFIIGAALSVIYDLMRIIRRLMKNPGYKSVFVQDFIYCLAVTAVYIVFIFAANLGIPRFFSAASAALGFLFFHFAFGKYIVCVGEKAAGAFRKIFCTVFFIIVKPLEILLSFLAKKAKTVLCKLTICKKFFKNLFIFMKKRNMIYLYTSRYGKYFRGSDERK